MYVYMVLFYVSPHEGRLFSKKIPYYGSCSISDENKQIGFVLR